MDFCCCHCFVRFRLSIDLVLLMFECVGWFGLVFFGGRGKGCVCIEGCGGGGGGGLTNETCVAQACQC